MMNAAEIEAQAADWLARKDGAGWSEQQELALQAWIAASTAHRVAYLRLAHVWQRADRLGSLQAPAQIQPEPIPEPKPNSGNGAWHGGWRIAAGVLLAVAIGAGVTGWRGQPGHADVYLTDIGNSRAVALADGTRVTLNTDTRLAVDMQSGSRQVRLERGEAYFDVAHDAARPFVIDAGTRRVTVLGTRFSVRRDSDGKVSVAVVEGRVRVEPAGPAAANSPAAATILTRNDMELAEAGRTLVMHKSAAQIADELGWRDGKLVFDQMTLSQAAAQFNRYNRKQLVILDPAVGQIRIGGRFETGNVDAFARLLQQGFGLAVESHGDRIAVSR